MLSTAFTVAFLSAWVIAHGDHDDQKPVAGPHKSLWYNTLPGDGGTQVGQLIEVQLILCEELNNFLGRLGLLWYFDFWPPAILPMPCK
jgi:hypothetical protein